MTIENPGSSTNVVDNALELLLCFRIHVVFNGRYSRSEFWWWELFVIIGAVVSAVADSIIGTYLLLYAIWPIATYLPGLAVIVRRLHDRDKSGWWILIGFIPWIGSIILLIWFISRGTDGSNRFGEDSLQA